MSESLRVRLVQAASSTDAADNRAALSRVDTAGADLVVWPEAFARDFGRPGSPLGVHAESLEGPFVSALADHRGDATVVAGMFETSADPERPFNTLVALGADGLASYRKIHLYDSFGYRESDVLTPGETTPGVIDVDGWRVGLMTCYDLRFPELARALVDEGAEAIVVPAAWVAGERKVDHWRTLVRARAISALTRSCTPLVVWPVARSLSITAWKRSTSPEQPVPPGMRKVLGVTPGAACSGGGAGGALAVGVWQAESRTAASARTGR